jgi:competence protein ComFC
LKKFYLLRIFFGEDCVYCGGELASYPFLCEKCINSITPQPGEDILSVPYLDGYKTFAPYKGVAETLIHLVKFEGVKRLLTPLGKMVEPYLKGYIKQVNPSVVTYVPTNPFRYWFVRGFDPVEEILKIAGVSYRRVIKRRWLYRNPLARAKSLKERQKLVKGAFKIDARFAGTLKGKTVLVVDDILTSGTTASEIAYLLKSVGVKEIYLFAVFRARNAS